MEQRAAWVGQWKGWKRNWKGAGARARLGCGRGGAEGGTAAGDIITNAGKAGVCQPHPVWVIGFPDSYSKSGQLYQLLHPYTVQSCSDGIMYLQNPPKAYVLKT